jgi:hypothetical protein
MRLVGIAGLCDDVENRGAIFQELQRTLGTFDLPDEAKCQTGRAPYHAPHGS